MPHPPDSLVVSAGESPRTSERRQTPPVYFGREDARLLSVVKVFYRTRRVYTLSHPTVGDWLLVDGRHVERVGAGDPPVAERTVDLPGTIVIPRFIDTHVHLTGTGLSGLGIPIERARSASELLGLVAEELTHEPTKILAHGFDESHWERRALPTAADLNDLGDVPII